MFNIKTPLRKIRQKMRFDQKKEWDKIAFSFLNRCKSIVDVGCGEGRFISQDKNRIIGVDWNESSLNKCKLLGYNVIKGDVKQLPFEDSSIEGIHCSHVLEHFMPLDVHKILSEFDRILMPKGILAIRVPLLWRHFYSDLTHIRPYNPDAIIHYLVASESRTLAQISENYRVLHLKKRYGYIESKNRHIDTIYNFLNRWGFPWLEKSGFMLVMRKNA